MKGLIIKEPWIDLILSGEKVWEIRGTDTKIRGTIALIKSGSGTVVALCDLKDVIGPLSLNKIRRTKQFHAIPSNMITNKLPYPNTYAWVLDNTICLCKAVSYRHPRGAVIWVNLPNKVVNQLFQQVPLKLQRKENTMTLKQDLKALQREIKAFEKKMNKLVMAFEKSKNAKVAKKPSTKSSKAKTATEGPAKKAPEKKKSAKLTAADQVIKIVNRSKKGVNIRTLMEKTGFNQKKITNILHRTFKMGKIKRAGKGVYVGV